MWKVPKSEHTKVTHALKQLRLDPLRGGGNAKKCFKHKYTNVYRYRIGDYRLIYCVGSKCIKLLMIGSRGEIYKRFEADPDIDIGKLPKPSDLEPKPIRTQ